MSMTSPATHSEQRQGIKPSHRPASVSSEDREVQVAAAKLRVTLDRRLGRETPEWLIALSEETPE